MQMHGGNIEEVSKKYNLKEDAIIDFSSNINPLGFPRGVQALLRREGYSILRYPDPNAIELKQAIARVLDLDVKNILVGNGSTELIYLIPRVFKPKCALVSTPTFSEYDRSLFSIDCGLKYLPLKEKEQFRINIDAMRGLLSNIDIIYLCNPNNPTGALLPESEAIPLIVEAERKGVLVVVDEAFMDFADDESAVEEVKKRKNLIIIKSLTKFFGIPGLRLGYLVANARTVDKMNHHQEPWAVNILAQKIGTACVKNNTFRLKTKSFVNRERKYLLAELQKIKGLRPYSSSTNYILIKIVKPGLSSDKLYEKMAQKGLLIRDCRSFKGLSNKFIRVAVKKRRENTLLIKNLKRILEK